MSSGNIRNLRDTWLHFLADNLASSSVHPVRWDKNKPEYNTLQISKLNVTFHDATYSASAPSSQFISLDILHDDELDALDLEEKVIALLQLGGEAYLMDYSQAPPAQVGNSRIYWQPQGVKFRTVASIDYFHRSCVLQLFVRYV